MNKLLAGVSAGVLALVAGGTALAQDLPGKFEGVTIDAKLIGGQQYENLYSRIAEWEAATGATVNVISKKNHFDLDKEIKSDIAVGAVNWCVGSNHSSFAPQYPGIYTDLSKLLPKEEIDALQAAFRILCRSKLNTTQAIEKLEAEGIKSSHVRSLVDFVRTSARGVVK